MKSFIFITTQKVFGAYTAVTVEGARKLWARDLKCKIEELPKCEVFVL